VQIAPLCLLPYYPRLFPGKRSLQFALLAKYNRGRDRYRNRNRDRYRKNMALGHEKTAEADRRSYFEIARKVELDRMAAMLSRLRKQGCSVQKKSSGYGVDFDSDSDFDPDETLNVYKPRE